MASVTILSDNGATSGSAGLKTSGGNDGVLLLQTTTSGGTPTTAISISNTQVVTYTNQPTYTGGTANGVLYLNGSKAVTSGTALVFDGNNLGIGVTPSAWGSDFRAIEFAGGTLWSDNTASGGNVNLYKNTFTQNGYVYKYKNSVNAFGYTQNQNGHSWYTAPAGTAGNTITFTQAMTLDASGNLGLGVTPSAWGSGWKALQFGSGGSAFTNGTTDARIGANTYYTGSTFAAISTGAASRYEQVAGVHYWLNAPSVTAGTSQTFTQAMTLDASGNLGIGATSVSANLQIQRAVPSFWMAETTSGTLQRVECSVSSVGVFNQNLNWNAGSASRAFTWSQGGTENMRIDTSGTLLIGRTSSPAIADAKVAIGGTGNTAYQLTKNGVIAARVMAVTTGLAFGLDGVDGSTEVARFDSSGNFYVGGTSGGKRANFIGPATVDITYTETNSAFTWNAGPISTGPGRFNWYNATGSADRMYLTTAGALYNSTGTYGTISDVSLKENIVDATPKLADVMRVRVRNYNMKSDPDKRKVIGVIAQELEEVFPGLIEETVERVALDDGTFEETSVKAVKYSVLTTILVKAIQELKAEVDALKGQA